MSRIRLAIICHVDVMVSHALRVSMTYFEYFKHLSSGCVGALTKRPRELRVQP